MGTSQEAHREVAQGDDDEDELHGLLGDYELTRTTNNRFLYSALHIFGLYATIVVLFILVIALSVDQKSSGPDLSLQIFSPAQESVEYIPHLRFRAALFNQTDYMGFPNDHTDKLWSELYNYGISKISANEAKNLPVPTLSIPGTQDFLVELDVFHELHCLNDLRKLLFPERYNMMETITFPNGTINRQTADFQHWDHCVDSIRQTLMCHADVSPIAFHVNVPANKGIFPRLATVHTCRNFEKIWQWSVDHWAGEWDFSLSPEKAEEIIANAPDDQGPWEDIQFMYESFPGNKYFEYWRTHEVTESTNNPTQSPELSN